ncbi:MAG: Crp/Fnr family transcriptional regulator [Christensenellales bacterium]
MMKDPAVLDCCALFAPCSKETKEYALSHPLCRAERFRSGEMIYSAGRFERSLGIILSGRCRVTKPSADGREIVMSALKAGDVFGAAALFTEDGDYVTSVRAVSSVSVLFLGEELVHELLQMDFALCERYLSYLCGRIRFLNKRIEAFTGGSAEQRLLSYVVGAAREEGGRKITPAVSATRLAQALDIGRASLYRAMDALVEQGRIAKEGKRLVLLESASADPLPTN